MSTSMKLPIVNKPEKSYWDYKFEENVLALSKEKNNIDIAKQEWIC